MEKPKKGTKTQARASERAASVESIEPGATLSNSKDPIDIQEYLDRLNNILAQATSKLTRLAADGYGTSQAPPPYSPGTSIKRKAYELGTDINEEDDEDEALYVTHDPASEELPHLPIYHPAYKVVENLVPETLQVFHDFIKASPYSDAEVEHLLNEIDAHLKIPYGNTLRFGLVGEAGAGKSALLNSVFGIPNLAVEGSSCSLCDGVEANECPQGAEGESVTNVVMEFSPAPDTQKSPFAAEIEFFTPVICQRMIEGLVRQCFRRTQKEREGQDADEEENAEANTALDCLCILFSNREEFSSLETAENFMASAVSPKDPRIVDKLQKWTSDMLAFFIPNGRRLFLNSTTMEDLTEQFIPFTRSVKDAMFRDEPLGFSPWPFVRLVRVCFHHPILQQGITLADLPGSNDYNKIRVEGTKRYLRDCDISICVAKSDRPETSSSLQQHYTDAHRRRRSGSVILVITRSDDLNMKTKSIINLSPQEDEILGLIAKQVKILEKRAEENRREIKRVKGDINAVNTLAADNGRIDYRAKKMKNEALELRILARNAKITNALARNYRTNTRDDVRVPIFCVSNTEYMLHVAGTSPSDLPVLSLAHTQLPLFRAHIYAARSKGKFAALDHYSLHSVPTMINIVEMSCSTSNLDRKEHLVGIVNKASEEMEEHIGALFESFVAVKIEELIQSLRTSQANFVTEAGKKCKIFSQKPYGPAGHRAFIRNSGNHKTKGAGAANWNDEFLEAVKPALDRSFGKLLEEHSMALRTDLSQSIREVMHRLDQDLRDDPAALVCNAYKTVFLDNFKRYQKNVTKSVNNTALDLQKEFRTIHVKSATDGETHYFTDAMEPIYASSDIAAPPRGYRTLHLGRCHTFNTQVCAAEGPYLKLLGVVQAKCKQALEQQRRKLSSEINAILKQIKKDFENMSTKKGNDLPEAKEFRVQFNSLVPLARSIIQGPVRECLDLCRQYK